MSLQNLGQALTRLEQALARPAPDDLEMDGTIQRFEFSVELFWKTLRRALLEERRVAESPRQAIAGAWRMGWLEDDEELWTGMLDDRNLTSHVYRESVAREVFGRIAGYASAMRTAHGVLVARFCPASSVREKRVPYRRTPTRSRSRSRSRSRASRGADVPPRGRGRGRNPLT
jgi:nucleotidyltransferase substrate binding protein (TIGR01987 family)